MIQDRLPARQRQTCPSARGLAAGLSLTLGLMAPVPALAQSETEIKDQVFIELNTTQSGDNACTLTFQVVNGHAAQIDKAVYEAVLFNTDGQVDRLTLFDFGTLPPARPRVRQFSLTGTTCDGLSRILINGVHACEGTGVPEGACQNKLDLATRTEIEMIG